MATDILGAVYDYIKTYAWDATDPDCPQYRDDQIIRGGLNEMAVTKDKMEMCIIYHQHTTRHGTNHYRYLNQGIDDAQFVQGTSEVVEHLIQVDMVSAEPVVRQEVTAKRAQAIEMLSRSPIGTAFFKSRDLNLISAEDVTVINQWDETKNYLCRYTLKLHLEQRFEISTPIDYFNKVRVKSVRAHTPETRQNEPGYLLTENVDNNHT